VIFRPVGASYDDNSSKYRIFEMGKHQKPQRGDII